jgi:type II secretory pathway pseudopilin PulG
MATRRDKSRRGLTMVELLVVIGLILVLGTLTLTISPRVAEDQRAARTADLITGWLLSAKQRAYRDQQSRGIRLVVSPDGTQAREMMYIERPEDYRGGLLQVPSPFATGPIVVPGLMTVPPAYVNATAFVLGKDLTNGFPLNEKIVAEGDFLVLDTMEQPPYNSHRIYHLTYVPPGTAGAPPAGGTHIVCATYDGSSFSVINSGSPIANLSSDKFRFVRQPRPLQGEPNLQLPRDMIVDLSLPPSEGGSILPGRQIAPPPPDRYDIIFTPRGSLQGTNALTGKIVLRIRNATRDTRDGDQTLIVIYTRSGVIAAHPLNLNTDALGNLVDPYLFIRDGQTSGL